MAKVLIISDEPAAAEIWEYSLNQLGLETALISVADPVFETWENETPDLIIIEDFNEQTEELAICAMLREVTVVPLLYLTAKTNERFQMDVYQAGADECILFPITPRIFQAKVKAWLRRTSSLPMALLNEIAVGGFRLDPGQRLLDRPEREPARLTALETRLLVLLMSNAGRVLSPEEIVAKVWGYQGVDDRKLVKNHIFRLRRKIERDPAQPRTLVSAGSGGYLFQAE